MYVLYVFALFHSPFLFSHNPFAGKARWYKTYWYLHSGIPQWTCKNTKICRSTVGYIVIQETNQKRKHWNEICYCVLLYRRHGDWPGFGKWRTLLWVGYIVQHKIFASYPLKTIYLWVAMRSWWNAWWMLTMQSWTITLTTPPEIL